MSIDAKTIFNPAELSEMQELIEINDRLKVLEERKKDIANNIKSAMIGKNISSTELNGSTFTLIESVRRIVTKKTKDDFIAELIAKQKNHLVIHSIEPDVDSIMLEVDSGLLDRAFVEQYVKITPTVTLRCV